MQQSKVRILLPLINLEVEGTFMDALTLNIDTVCVIGDYKNSVSIVRRRIYESV